MSNLKQLRPSKERKFEDNTTYLPVTMDQFQGLTNEILTAVNEVCAPHFLNADYLAQILMSAIHALDHKHGLVRKSDLFESCINRISCHVTYHAVQEIQKRLAPKEGNENDGTGESDPKSSPPEDLPELA